MTRYQVLLQERADLIAEARRLYEQVESEGRTLTDDERRRDDEINARLEVLADEIGREERRRAWERTVQAVPDSSAANPGGREQGDPRGGYRDLADFALSVLHACRPGGYVDQRLQIRAAPTGYMQEAGTGEGYMVPASFREEIWSLVFSGDDLLALVNPEPTASNAVEMLADESTPWGATGIQARWRSEASQMTASKLDTKLRQVRLHELYAFVLATDELLQDAPRLNARLTRGAADAIRWKASEAIMFGTGAGQPLGWMTAPCLVSVAKEAGQAADTIVAANVAKMFARVIDPGRSLWLVNQDVIPQLVTMTLGNQPIWTPPATGLASAPGGFLMGRPIQFSEHCASLGDQGDIQLVNPVGYYAATRQGGPQFASSIHLYFDYNMQAFRWTFRLGGQPFLSAPVSPAKGTNTRSHFVVLDERA